MFLNILHPKESNIKIDLLSNLANTNKPEHLKTIIQETLQTPTIDAEDVMTGEDQGGIKLNNSLQELPNSSGTPVLNLSCAIPVVKWINNTYYGLKNK